MPPNSQLLSLLSKLFYADEFLAHVASHSCEAFHVHKFRAHFSFGSVGLPWLRSLRTVIELRGIDKLLLVWADLYVSFFLKCNVGATVLDKRHYRAI